MPTQTGSLGKLLTNQNVTYEQGIAIFFPEKPIILKNMNDAGRSTKNEELRATQETLSFVDWLAEFRSVILYTSQWLWFYICRKMNFHAKFYV